MDRLTDEKYIKRCFRLAVKAEGWTNPNPMVGCVIVKNNKIIGEAYHRKYGGSHAEFLAIKKVRCNFKGACLYTNLEPCNHYGNTPPCTEAIIESGIKRVVYSMKDPNPVNNGKGIKALKDSGIKLKGGVLKDKAEELNKIYIQYIKQKMPYVSIKVAQSLDGKIATYNGFSKWITTEKSRYFVQNLRNKCDAVLVGINTVLKDNPELIPKVKSSNKVKNIKRIILDSNLKIPIGCKLFKDLKKFPLIIFTTKKAGKRKIKKLEDIGVEVIIAGNKNVNILYALKCLAKKNISHLLVEGGGNVIADFFEKGLVNDFFWFVAPKIIGGKNAITSVEGKGVAIIDKAVDLKIEKIETIGKDILIYGNNKTG